MAPAYPQQCNHRHNVPLSQTLLYCLALSSFFVLSLYAFVPASVRRLPRDNVLHIKWRSGVILGVTIAGVGVYPILFCQPIVDGSNNDFSASSSNAPWHRYLGFRWQPVQDLRIVLHVFTLYLGSFVCIWFKIYHHARMLHCEKERASKKGVASRRFASNNPQSELPRLPRPKYLWMSLNVAWIQPTVQSCRSFCDDEVHRWTKLRNLFIAPLAEEVVFRACLVPPLLACRTDIGNVILTPTKASWIAPLFFGVAHLHHFHEQYRLLPPYQRSKKLLLQLLLVAMVQWMYTTLFGAYASHVFIRTASLSGVTLAHIICNYMGLPDVSFFRPISDLHVYVWFITISYLFGIMLFAMGFESVLFPSISVLPQLLPRNTLH